MPIAFGTILRIPSYTTTWYYLSFAVDLGIAIIAFFILFDVIHHTE